MPESRTIEAAREHIRAQDFPDAIDQLESVLRLDASCVEARELLVSIREAIERRSRTRDIERLLNRGEAYLERGDFARAHAAASRVFDLAPDNQVALRLLELSSEAGAPVTSATLSEMELLGPDPEEARLIERIEHLLVDPPEPTPASTAAAVVARVDTGDPHDAQPILVKATEEFLDTTELAATEQWDEVAEPAELEARLERTEHVRPKPVEPEPVAKADQQVPRVLEQLAPAVPASSQQQGLQARSPALESPQRIAQAPLKNVLVSLAILAVLALAITLLVRLELPAQGDSPPRADAARSAAEPTPVDPVADAGSPRQSGHLDVVLSSPGAVALEDLGRESRKNAVIHRFSGVEVGAHAVTVWRQGESVRLVRKVRVEQGKTARLEVDVPW